MTRNNLNTIKVIDEFDFHYFDKPIPVVKASNGALYGQLSSLCALFSLKEAIEIERLQHHTILNKTLVKVSTDDVQDRIFMRLSHMATWLLTIPLQDLPHEKDQIELAFFQENASQYLEEAMYAGKLTDEPLLSELLEYNSPFGMAFQEALSVLGLAREQLIKEGNSTTFRIQYKKHDEASF